MIFDELVSTTHSLNDLKKKTDLKNNKALQDNLDARYRVLISQTATFVMTLDYLYSKVMAEKSYDTIAATSELIGSLEKAIESGLASQEELSKAENSYKTLQNSMKKEWAKLYTKITGTTISTLEAIQGIDPEKVSACIQKISNAENWEVGVGRLQSMVKGIDNAKQLILELGLDSEIILFLQKTNEGKATLKDMNDKVFNWLRKENLENKIRMSFVKSSNCS